MKQVNSPRDIGFYDPFSPPKSHLSPTSCIRDGTHLTRVFCLAEGWRSGLYGNVYVGRPGGNVVNGVGWSAGSPSSSSLDKGPEI